MKFPIIGTKMGGVSESFDLNDPADRWKYFHRKGGIQIERLKQYLDKNTFVGFLLAKKSAGKGTYSKMFAEVVGSERFEHLSIGDLVRETHKSLEGGGEEDLKLYLEKNYRGFISVDEAVNALLNRSTKTLIPTEVILALVKRKIEKISRKAVFIDGFPRDLDQVSYSLYFREIMNLRDDPDFFVLIHVPGSVIDARMKSRVICPLCNTSRNTTLLPTKFVEYDQEKQQVVLKCDNPECKGYGKAVLVGKEGDELGIESIRERIEKDEHLIEMAFSLHGVSKILLRNAIPLDKADKFDSYEITPKYSYEYDKRSGKVRVSENPWIVEDDSGTKSYSLLAPPVVLSLIYQLYDLLDLGR